MALHYPRRVLAVTVSLLLVANTVNLGAMAAALKLVIGRPQLLYVGLFALVSVLLEIFVRYSRYVSVLRWLTLALFAYVVMAFVVKIPWGSVGYNLVAPHIQISSGYITTAVSSGGSASTPTSAWPSPTWWPCSSC